MSYYPYPTQVMVSPPRRTSTAHLVVAWIVALVTLLYMLPWAVAASRHKSNTGAIALINLFLGWSLIGWVVALVMACSAESNQPQVIVMNGHGMPAYPVQGQAQLYGQAQTYGQAQLYGEPIYPQQQLPAAYPQVAPAPYTDHSAPYTDHSAPYTDYSAPYVADPTPFPSSPATAAYPTSPTTAAYPTSPATAAYPSSATTAPSAEAWARPADPVSNETVPLQLVDPYAGGAAEITRPLPALSDPSSEGHGRQ